MLWTILDIKLLDVIVDWSLMMLMMMMMQNNLSLDALTAVQTSLSLVSWRKCKEMNVVSEEVFVIE